MSMIELPMDLDDIQEDKPVAEGEYNLVISECKARNDESGDLKGLLVICEIEGQTEAAKVLHNISLPLPGDDEEKVKNKLKFMKRFVSLFKIPVKGGKIYPEAFLGKRAKAFLVIEEYNGEKQNKIKLPKAE